jgi:hypothetical protein
LPREFRVSEEGSRRKRARLLARIIVVVAVLAVNITCIMAVVTLVESGTATPYIQVMNFTYDNHGNNSSAYVQVDGTVVNPSSLTANNVSVLIDVYDAYVATPVGTSDLDLGSVPGNSSEAFTTHISYPGTYYDDFVDGYYGVNFGLQLASRFDFGILFFAVALPIAVLLPVLDLYCAYKLGLFGWIRARKKAVAATLVWSGAVALVAIVRFCLFYSANVNAIGGYVYPQFSFWDWPLIFIVSFVAGAVIADLGTVVYSFFISLILSVIFDVLCGSLFIWYGLGYGGSFTRIVPGLSFTTFLQGVVQEALLAFLRMINIAVPVICILAVFLGAFVRSYFEPTMD